MARQTQRNGGELNVTPPPEGFQVAKSELFEETGCKEIDLSPISKNG